MFHLPALTRPYSGSYADGLLSRADRTIREHLPAAIATGEAVASSFVFGVIQGKYKNQGGLTLFLPVDLMAGLLCHTMALFDFAKPYKDHLRAVGTGALASFACTTGYRVGERAAASGSLFKGLSGMFGDDSGKEPAGGGTMADKQLDELVRAG